MGSATMRQLLDRLWHGIYRCFGFGQSTGCRTNLFRHWGSDLIGRLFDEVIKYVCVCVCLCVICVVISVFGFANVLYELLCFVVKVVCC